MPKRGSCVVPQCRNSSEKTANPDASYEKFPIKEKNRRRWIKTIQAHFKFFDIEGTSIPRLCSEHFEDECFVAGKGGKRLLKIEALPTIFASTTLKQEGAMVRSRHQSRRAASKEALKQMQILLEDEDDAVEVPDDDDYDYRKDLNIKEEIAPAPTPAPAPVSPPKKKYKLSHRKSSDDRELIVLRSVTPTITNHNVENNLELECYIEELEPCQKARNQKLQEEEKIIKEKLEELIKSCQGEVIYKGELTTVIEISENVQQTIQTVQMSNNAQPVIVNNAAATAQSPSYQLVMDSRLGIIVSSVAQATPVASKNPKIQGATSVQAPANQLTPTPTLRTRAIRAKKSTGNTPIPPLSTSPTPTVPKTLVNIKPGKRVASQSPANTPPATRSKGNDGAPQPAASSSSQIGTRARANFAPNTRPTECNVTGGLTTGSNLKSKTIVDLTGDDGKPLPDSREVAFNKLQGKTFPSLVVVARPHLRVTDINHGRSKLDSKVKGVLMYSPEKFTEWLIQQGLLKAEQKCLTHTSSKMKLALYSDVSKFPYSGGYVWISQCCPQRFVSVFNGSIFEGSPHPPLMILKVLYHWACQTNIQNVIQWVKVDNLFVKEVYMRLRAVCTVALQMHSRKHCGPQTKVEVGVISLGTTSQDGNSRQVKVEVLGVLETSTKFLRLRAIEPLPEFDRTGNHRKRFARILEPLKSWVHPSSTIITDITVDKTTLQQMGFKNVVQAGPDARHSNQTIMWYLRKIVPRMFQNTLSLLSRQIIQQFLDELVWREWFGPTSLQAFENIVLHLAEQTRQEASQSLIARLSKVAGNPFKFWSANSNNDDHPPAIAGPSGTKAADGNTLKKTSDTALAKKRKGETARPPKSVSPDVPEQMVPVENYYYGTIDNYPPKMNVTISLKCPFCKETYTNNITLMDHLFRHVQNVADDGEMCRYCLTSVPSANYLTKHITMAHPSESKHENGFVCLICETEYMNPFILGKHMSKEHCPAELPYKCSTCGYRCSNHKQVIDHFYQQHENGSTMQCPFCLKATTIFSASRNIINNINCFVAHLQKHQSKQCAKRCGKCNLWFVQRDVQKEHQLKMHVSQRGRAGLVPWPAPRNGIMVPKSKSDKYPCDGDIIDFNALFYNLPKGLKCKECDNAMDNTKHFPSFERCQNPNCQYSTCCSSAMQKHNADCNKKAPKDIPPQPLPYVMFCICGFSSEDGNQMAKHLALCEKKSAYPSLSEAQSASITHSMLDVLGLVRKPDEPTDKKPIKITSVAAARKDVETISLVEDEAADTSKTKPEEPNTPSASDKETIKDANISTLAPSDIAEETNKKQLLEAEPEAEIEAVVSVTEEQTEKSSEPSQLEDGDDDPKSPSKLNEVLNEEEAIESPKDDDPDGCTLNVTEPHFVEPEIEEESSDQTESLTETPDVLAPDEPYEQQDEILHSKDDNDENLSASESDDKQMENTEENEQSNADECVEVKNKGDKANDGILPEINEDVLYQNVNEEGDASASVHPESNDNEVVEKIMDPILLETDEIEKTQLEASIKSEEAPQPMDCETIISKSDDKKSE